MLEQRPAGDDCTTIAHIGREGHPEHSQVLQKGLVATSSVALDPPKPPRSQRSRVGKLTCLGLVATTAKGEEEKHHKWNWHQDGEWHGQHHRKPQWQQQSSGETCLTDADNSQKVSPGIDILGELFKAFQGLKHCSLRPYPAELFPNATRVLEKGVKL